MSESEKICADPNAAVVACGQCGGPVHTCDRKLPNNNDFRCPVHTDGVEMWDGRWACSERCAYLMHPEAKCQKCGGRNIVWFSDNQTWNLIAPADGILCPICFVEKAEEIGIVGPWKLTLEPPLAEEKEQI